jgi:hypothetical protein
MAGQVTHVCAYEMRSGSSGFFDNPWRQRSTEGLLIARIAHTDCGTVRELGRVEVVRR